jgi:SAM-dependent methyltransferase
MHHSPADWQLPPGINRGLWDYLHDEQLARGYDASLAGSPLFAIDQEFVQKFCPQPGRLLDLGCGTGRVLVPLARRGYWVLGVDLSSEMLAVARDKAAAENVIIHLLQANLTELDCLASATFDYAACLFSTLGMVMGRPHRQRAVEHVFRLLRPGGRFILHVHNRWFNFWDRPGRAWLLRNGLGSLLRACVSSLTLRVGVGKGETGDRVMPPHQGIAGLTLHHFTRREVIRLLTRAGFRILEVQPLGLRPDGRLPLPWLFGWLRAYGYLLVAERPDR